MEEAALDIFLPVLESATVLAAHYSRACGRDIILAEDIRIGLMYAARHVAGKHLGSIYPEIYEESESDGESVETVSDDDTQWEKYSGDDEISNKMNECMETWDAWTPETPAERALKNSVDKQREI
jgi:hypothetical protein